MKTSTLALLVSALSAFSVANAQSTAEGTHTQLPHIDCGADILVDDFAVHRREPLPGETMDRDINLLGGDYGAVEVAMNFDTAKKAVELTAGANPSNFFFAKFDAGACFDLTHIEAVRFDLVAPAGSSFTMCLTQKSADCLSRVEPNGDSTYIPISKYITPNGQKQTVTVPFRDFAPRASGPGTFDFVHLKDWTLNQFTPAGSVHEISNLRLVRQCTSGNSTTTPSSTATTSATGTASVPASSSTPSTGTNPTGTRNPNGSPTGGANPTTTGTPGQDVDSGSTAVRAGFGLGGVVMAALAWL
ncbi:hypothetical protein BC832DRAFT_282940 [Gaertneriomyces semiglobifer]|nr:hypothetical protein BC832DRAFT_282940 [Gaertneriomyces semiglobifer]